MNLQFLILLHHKVAELYLNFFYFHYLKTVGEKYLIIFLKISIIIIIHYPRFKWIKINFTIFMYFWDIYKNTFYEATTISCFTFTSPGKTHFINTIIHGHHLMSSSSLLRCCPLSAHCLFIFAYHWQPHKLQPFPKHC